MSKRNYRVSKKLARGVADYYFLWHQDQLLGLSFTSYFEIDQQFERDFIELLTSGAIPEEVYQSMRPTNVNFAGREIQTRGCNWMNPNNLQCPYNGQMNWSSFKTMDAAQRELDAHFNFISSNGRGKIISDEQVNVVFEGQDIKARKIVFDLTGVTSALASMTGGKTLTAYFVAASVRDKVVQCVMSHWNNDTIGEGGLPALLAEVMQLK